MVPVPAAIGRVCVFLLLSVRIPAAEAPPGREISLGECLQTALSQNREIQIERINPRVAQLTLEASYGAYDPFLFADNRWESLADSGGFDPADFSRDAIYEADSEVSRFGLTGLLPTGLTYAIAGDYAHSMGVRNSLDFDSYSIRLNITLRQPLLKNFWIDPARFAIRVNRSLVKSAEHLLRFRIMDVIQRTTFAYHELAFATENTRVHEDLVATRHALLDSVRRRIEGGTLTILEESLAASQATTAEANLLVIRNAVALADHELKNLLGHPWIEDPERRLIPESPMEFPVPDLDLTSSRASGLERRPELAQLREELSRTQLDIRFWRNQLFPGLDVVGSYGRRGASTAQVTPPLFTEASLSDAWDQVVEGSAPNHGIGFIFSMPLSRRLERSRFRASHELRAQAELRVKQFEEQVLREIADAHENARYAWERVNLTRQARAFAADALDAEERKLAGGKSTLYVVLQLQGDMAAARSAELRARADYLQALERLHFADGTLLEYHQILLEDDPHPGE
jgi:outer membrane protein TolC